MISTPSMPMRPTAARSRPVRVGSPRINAPWGDRTGSLIDPFEDPWMLATPIEDVDPDEVKRRMAQAQRG